VKNYTMRLTHIPDTNVLVLAQGQENVREKKREITKEHVLTGMNPGTANLVMDIHTRKATAGLMTVAVHANLMTKKRQDFQFHLQRMASRKRTQRL